MDPHAAAEASFNEILTFMRELVNAGEITPEMLTHLEQDRSRYIARVYALLLRVQAETAGAQEQPVVIGDCTQQSDAEAWAACAPPGFVFEDDGAPGDRVYLLREGRAIVPIPALDFEETKGIAAEGGDYYARYRDRSGPRDDDD